MFSFRKNLILIIFVLGYLVAPFSLKAESSDTGLQCPQLLKYQECEVLGVGSVEKTSTYLEKSFSNHYSPGHPDYGFGDYEIQDKSHVYKMKIKDNDWVYTLERKLRPSHQPAWKAEDLLYCRVSKDSMYLKKSDGSELKMKIVERRVAENPAPR